MTYLILILLLLYAYSTRRIFSGTMLGMKHFLEPRKAAFGVYCLNYPQPLQRSTEEKSTISKDLWNQEGDYHHPQ